MLGSESVMAFSATANPEAARTFYEDALGLTFVADEQYALVFDIGGTMLRLQKVEEVATIPYTVLGWEVDDIERTVDSLTAKGVAFELLGLPGQDDRGIWNPGGGTRVAWFRDPDGNILSLTQLPERD